MTITFDDYQKAAWSTALPSAQHTTYMLTGAMGELGELAEIFAKSIRDRENCILADDMARIKKECGDLLWMIAGLCSTLEISLDEVAAGNLAKLADRAKRGVIGGSGDER